MLSALNYREYSGKVLLLQQPDAFYHGIKMIKTFRDLENVLKSSTLQNCRVDFEFTYGKKGREKDFSYDMSWNLGKLKEYFCKTQHSNPYLFPCSRETLDTEIKNVGESFRPKMKSCNILKIKIHLESPSGKFKSLNVEKYSLLQLEDFLVSFNESKINDYRVIDEL